MQVNKFITYINSDDQLVNASHEELLPLVNEFPYCQTGQIMYAVHLHSKGSLAFEEQLKKTAAYAGERERLFHLIHPKESEVAGHEVPNQEVNITEPQHELVEPSIEPETKKEREKDEELTTLEKEYLTQAISSSILLESDEEVKKLGDEAIGETEEVREVNLFDEKKEHSFNDWLKHFNGDEPSDLVDDKKHKKVNFDLIDKFIQEDPRIKPNKKTFYSPTNMARKSVTNDGFVSETLAVIHMDQGNYEEAIKTYEKLILNNPKKRSYFASQIKILKQKLKQ